MTTVLLVVGFLWLLALTLLLAGVARHTAALELAGAIPPGGGSAYNFDTDGPWIPSPLPAQVVEIFAETNVALDDLTAVFFSSSCRTCLKQAEDIAADGIDASRTVFLLTGSRPEGLADFRQFLTPTGGRILTDPHAHDIVKSLDINSTPFVFRVLNGQVVNKSHVRNIDDFRRMMTVAEEVSGFSHEKKEYAST